MAKVPQIYKDIQALRVRYYELALKKSALLEMIAQAEVAEQVYDSNAIENSTLSLDETEKILLQIKLDRGISERELFEAKNLARVVTYISNKAKQHELDKEMMLSLHLMLLSNINGAIAGRTRSASEWVRVGNHIAMDPMKVDQAIEELLSAYYARPNIHIVKRIAAFHLRFEHIHPFVDGNGRIGRVLNNYLLIREGYVPINIKFIDRNLYYDAFREYDLQRKTKIMEGIIGRALSNSYHKRLAYMEGKEIISLSEFAKKEKLSHPNLINKAKRQTIEAFLEKGKWMIGC